MAEASTQIDCIVTQPITKGSIILTRNEQINPEELPYVMNELRRVAGHDRFLLMCMVEGASLAVHGPDDLVEAIRQLAKEAINGPEDRTEAEAPAERAVPEVRLDDSGEGGTRSD
jgi:hypothetical protein